MQPQLCTAEMSTTTRLTNTFSQGALAIRTVSKGSSLACLIATAQPIIFLLGALALKTTMHQLYMSN